ncbi:MAG: hypothetical protein OXG38_09860 [Chloroflexi bacterium]|nr:hypothetical protein [Chloroflexota bacterium]
MTPRPLATLVLAVLALLLAWSPATAQAAPLRIDGLGASPREAAADGGRITITVSVSDVAPAGESITLATTRGAFGAAAGPTRIVLPVRAGDDGGAVVTAVLVGNGSAGPATVTATAPGVARRVNVRFIGEPAFLSFISPAAGVQSAQEAGDVTVQAYDALGTAVAGAAITLSADQGRLSGGGAQGATITVTSDARGRAAARLDAPLGPVRLEARAGFASAAVTVRLVGPPADMALAALRPTINLNDDPFPAPPRSLVVVIRDEIGQAVAGVPVAFEIDAPGVRVVSDAPGGSLETDAAGAVRAHLSSGPGSAPGMITVTARAAGLERSAEVRVAGPPASMLLFFSELGGAEFALRALLRDAAGQPVATGYEVQWRALNVPPGGTVSFAPSVALSRGGSATTVATVTTDPPASVRVQAVVVDSDPAVAASAPLPAPLPTSGTPLQAGLNALVWAGPHTFISDAVASIARVAVSVWRLDQGAGWQGYFPGAGIGQDYLVAPGDALWIRVSQPVLLPNVEAAGAAP